MSHDELIDATAALVSSHFAAAAQAASRQGQSLAQGVAAAADRIVQCFLQNKKLLVCAPSVHRADGDALVARMLGQLEQTRPALPAIGLSSKPSSERSDEIGAAAIELQALGHTGDVLVGFAHGVSASELEALASVAQERGIQIIWLAQNHNAAVLQVRKEHDLVMWFDEQRIIRLLELQRIAVHALADAIDSLLLGDGA
jgi:D-sedoheptulose 7-phosphate isomerase